MMRLSDIKDRIPEKVFLELEKNSGIDLLRPGQEKTINQGLFERKNLLVCTPTASGKTFIAELAIINGIMKYKSKAVYIVPLKALATEKYKSFVKRYEKFFSIALAVGDLDSEDYGLAKADLIVCTAEKLDSLFRHKAQWTTQIRTVIIDEIHLLDDPSRGPTLEILITMLLEKINSRKNNGQLIGLSATIGNSKELAEWLNSELVEDNWRPVVLNKGIILEGKVDFIARSE